LGSSPNAAAISSKVSRVSGADATNLAHSALAISVALESA